MMVWKHNLTPNVCKLDKKHIALAVFWQNIHSVEYNPQIRHVFHFVLSRSVWTSYSPR